MCGIVGAIGVPSVGPVLIDGLSRLEYRGYDSAGLAVVNDTGLSRLRVKGKVAALKQAFEQTPLTGYVGIAHTRWATHGAPTKNNAHPHVSHERLAVVHNGIIENYQCLKASLQQSGYQFSSDTDTEVIVHLLHQKLQTGLALLEAVKAITNELEGAYALAIASADYPDQLIALRQGSPLVVGLGQGQQFVGSDVGALLPMTQQFMYLEEGDIARLTCQEVTVFNQGLVPVMRQVHQNESDQYNIDKSGFRHFMQKEIFSQPDACRKTLALANHCRDNLATLFGAQAKEIFEQTQQVHLVACGTSYHAALCAQYWLESRAGIVTQVSHASEFRYRDVPVPPNSLLVVMSQSGETADTIAACRHMMQSSEPGFLAHLAICNVDHSTLIRESQLNFLTQAGPEVGVAASKTFTTQLIAALLLSEALRQLRPVQASVDESFWSAMDLLPNAVEQALSCEAQVQQSAKDFVDAEHAIYIGRGLGYPIALEGALKLKEISYLHADAYPGGELKHGPLALIDKHMGVIVCGFNDHLVDKLKANIEEVQARGGRIYYIADEAVDWPMPCEAWIKMTTMPKLIAPIVYNIPLQLLAYHVAVLKGTDVDQPRNLAKSVTVE